MELCNEMLLTTSYRDNIFYFTPEFLKFSFIFFFYKDKTLQLFGTTNRSLEEKKKEK